MYIYKIENLLDGKFYIGKTSKQSVLDRWKTHLVDCKRGTTKLYNAIKKYGVDNFEIYQIEYTGPVSRERLNEREKYWIEVLHPEYNMTKGGDGGWINDQTGKRWKIKDTSRMRNAKTKTEAVIKGRLKTAGGNNYQSRFFIHTPWGVFETWRDAINEAINLKTRGIKNVIVNTSTLREYCLENKKLNVEGRRTPKEWRGKFTADIGFYVRKKHD